MKKKALFWGVIVGFLNGFFASGGGIVAVLILKNFFKIDETKSHATSLAIILPLTVAGLIVYTTGGYADMPVIIKTAAGASVGALLGATLLSKIPPDYIRLGFGAVMVVAAAKMIIGG